jgi:hypothetical protein
MTNPCLTTNHNCLGCQQQQYQSPDEPLGQRLVQFVHILGLL